MTLLSCRAPQFRTGRTDLRADRALDCSRSPVMQLGSVMTSRTRARRHPLDLGLSARSSDATSLGPQTVQSRWTSTLLAGSLECTKAAVQ